MTQLQKSLQSVAREMRVLVKKLGIISGKLNVAPAKVSPPKRPKRSKA